MTPPRRRVLIVSPHFPPVNAPDMQRVRMALPYLRDHGWEPVVLALRPDLVEGAVIDPLLEETYPADIPVVRAGGVSPRLTRWAGIGNLWWRCGRAFIRAGDALLREQKFDLVFISTTQFHAFGLGPRWHRRFGVPYVLDYQDPWINSYYRKTGTRPPGGRLRFAWSQLIARRVEPRALRDAAGIISVSDSYAPALAESYPWFDPSRMHLLPFGAAPADFVAAARHRPAQPLVDFEDGRFHFVYTGRCGPDMNLALTVLFRAFKRYLRSHPDEATLMWFHFIGTDYAPPALGRFRVLPLAQAEGVSDYVHEHCYRVTYFDALYYLSHAQALVAVGSDDPTYAASKIFPFVLARRPMLLIYHANSLVLKFARAVSAGLSFHFDGPEDIDRLAGEVHRDWFCGRTRWHSNSLDADALAPFTAEALTAKLAAFFDHARAPSGRPPQPDARSGSFLRQP